jgi:hypothetical protein
MTDPLPLAEAVRKACIEAALAAYEDAGISGLCAEGRWEAAISAIQSLNLQRIPGGDAAAHAPGAGSDATA